MLRPATGDDHDGPNKTSKRNAQNKAWGGIQFSGTAEEAKIADFFQLQPRETGYVGPKIKEFLKSWPQGAQSRIDAIFPVCKIRRSQPFMYSVCSSK